jgi:hypothetical protein
MNGEQFWSPAGLHAPRPSQIAAVFSLFPVQEGGTQVVPRGASLQPPTPSHRPFSPQTAVSCLQTPCGSLWSMSTGQQMPLPGSGRLQATHAPVQAVLQQTPSAQKPDWHSEPLAQACPPIFGPQLPALQTCPVDRSHWLSEVQVSKQALFVASQPNGEQIIVGPSEQTPAPSQTPIPTSAAPWQVPGEQIDPFG